MTRISARAPAKLNLGLQVLGRRVDGYHDIATIFQTIDLWDLITVEPADQLSVQIDVPLEGETNLAMNAATALQNRFQIEQGAAIHIKKQIPIAAGLGGGSSDAAATLRALDLLWSIDPGQLEMLQVALSIGSDVPFLLNGGTAIGRGRGELLHPLKENFESWVVLAAPNSSVKSKTETMFSKLSRVDFGNGVAISEIARRIESDKQIDVSSLPNSFARVIYEVLPQLRAVASAFLNVGAPGVAISGAGPTHYTLVDQEDEARFIAERLKQHLGTTAVVVACRTLARLPPPVRDNG
jgi:4-diphosphocytidyl-2-C-methyl-D-erythritol kinase